MKLLLPKHDPSIYHYGYGTPPRRGVQELCPNTRPHLKNTNKILSVPIVKILRGLKAGLSIPHDEGSWPASQYGRDRFYSHTALGRKLERLTFLECELKTIVSELLRG
jgi:hypothetical protein